MYGSGSPEAQGLLRDPDPEAEKTKQAEKTKLLEKTKQSLYMDRNEQAVHI